MPPQRRISECTLALIEAVNNAIFHAHRRQKHLLVGLAFEVKKNSLVISVSDSGVGIGRPARLDPERAVSGGRGLFLIENIVTCVDHLRTTKGHTVRMVCML